MKIKLKIEDNKYYFVLKYENNEWEEIKKILELLKLKEAETSKGFGEQRLKYYRETDTEFLNYLINTLNLDLFNIVDNINYELIDGGGRFNIAIFRVIPDAKGEVKIELKRFLTIAELRDIVIKLKRIYEVVLNLVVEKEVEIKVKEV